VKKRLLIWCDSPTVKTGFGIVAENLFRDLHKDFEVAILGVNYYGIHRYDTSKYFIYPVDLQDLLGLDRMHRVLPDWNPDVILLFQDVFNIDFILPTIKKWNDKVPIVAYFPIDGTPVSRTWGNTLLQLNKLITYTEWGVRVIKEAIPELEKVHIDHLYHGVNTDVFFPLPAAATYQLRKDKGWDEKFLAISNNRFQPRKHLPGALRAWALFSKGYKVCKCGNTYLASRPHCDLNDCPTSDAIEEHPGHEDVMLYLHCNTQERMMGPGRANILQAHMMNAGFENSDVNKVIAAFAGNVYANPITDEELNILYNIADVNLSTTLGEGVGLSLIESAAVGTTSIAPKNSAIPEMLGDTGHIIPNRAHINIAMDNGHMRPLVDTRLFVEALEKEYQKWVANGKKRVANEAAIDRVYKNFLWEDKREKMVGWLKEYA